MTTKEALALFDNSYRKLAEALGITDQAVRQWGDSVPELRVYQIKCVSGQVTPDAAASGSAGTTQNTSSAPNTGSAAQ